MIGKIPTSLASSQSAGGLGDVVDGQLRRVPSLHVLQQQFDVPISGLPDIHDRGSAEAEAAGKAGLVDERLAAPEVPVPRVGRGRPVRRHLPTAVRKDLVDDAVLPPDTPGHTVLPVVDQLLDGHPATLGRQRPDANAVGTGRASARAFRIRRPHDERATRPGKADLHVT
ncbi:hypothetical protein AB0M95_04205 [Sphaerisporangium sp. NPDC051017]|uniref:hypothetical protein n=1 Tax=Sphaerisporangium sp. NPDC051017 TaxID=3154636 RepID=UPI00342BB984